MGRKKMKTSQKIDIRVRADAALVARIKAVADQEGNSVAAFIRSAVVRELRRRELENPPHERPTG